MEPSQTDFGRERGRVQRRQTVSVWMFVSGLLALNILMVYVLIDFGGPGLATAPHRHLADALISCLSGAFVGVINLGYCSVFFKSYALRRQRDHEYLRRHPLRQPPLTH